MQKLYFKINQGSIMEKTQKPKAPAAKVTFQAQAYLDMKYGDLAYVAKGKRLTSYTMTDGSYYEREGYAQIGTAEITLTLHSNDRIVSGQISSLQKLLEKQRADAHMAERALLDQISKLQALTFDGSVAEAA